jgi:hypothetical protein
MGQIGKVTVGAILLLVAGLAVPPLAVSGEVATESLPENVFDKAPPQHRYEVWWRPIKTTFEPATVLQIEREIAGVSNDQAPTANLDAILGENRSSAFVYPVLATEGAKGFIFLKRRLADYSKRERVDDEWLLVIAALGMNATPGCEQVLEVELRRVMKEYGPSDPTREIDVRVPVLDALLACMARRDTLSAQRIEQLCQVVPAKTWFLWLAGLEWAQRFMTQEAVLDLVEAGLEARTDEDLGLAMNLKPTSESLRAIRDFLLGPRTLWPLARAACLRDAERERVSDYLLVLYSSVLVCQADDTGGNYELEPEAMNRFLSKKPPRCRLLSQNCAVLKECSPSTKSADWEAFLSQCANQLDPEDAKVTQYMVTRIHSPRGPAIQGLYDEPHLPADLTKPGVHLPGLKAARGRLAVASRASESKPAP